MELHTWNADAIAPAEVAPPPAGQVSPTAIGGAEGDGLVERLLREIDEKKDVIRRCGVEVIELRRQGAQLAAHNADLRSMLEKEKLAAANLAHDGDEEWEMLDLHELRKRSRLLRTKYRGERHFRFAGARRRGGLHAPGTSNVPPKFCQIAKLPSGLMA